MSVTLAVSVAGLTARAALIAGLAIVALLLAGWRKPARAEPRSHRAAGPFVPASGRRGVVVEHRPTPLYHRPGPLRRLLAFTASGGLGLLFGVLTAIVTAFAIALSVIWLTNLLEQ